METANRRRIFGVCGRRSSGLHARAARSRGVGHLLRREHRHAGWHHAIHARHHNEIGGDGPSSTPTIHQGRVYALGGTGVLRCLDAATGKEIWIRDVLADVGHELRIDSSGVWWGRSASPLIVDDLVVVPGGGPPAGPKVSLVAYNQATGEIVWKGGTRQVSYSSPSLATYGGVRQIVIVNEDTITGHDPKTGNVLWETKWDGSSNSSASASQTVPVDDEHFFVSKGYSAAAVRCSKSNTKRRPERRRSLDRYQAVAQPSRPANQAQ